MIAALLTLVVALAFGSHVTNGGFSSDDWPRAADFDDDGYGGAIGGAFEIQPGRPLMALVQPAPFIFLGTEDPVPHIVLALLLSVAAMVAFYALLRELGFVRLEAGTIATLALVFPWADSIRLWPTAGINEVGIILFFVAAIVSLRGVEMPGQRGWILSLAGTVLYAASVLTYQVAAGLALLGGLLYFVRAPVRRAAMKWLVDAVAIGSASVYSAIVSIRETQPAAAQVRNALDLAKTSASLTLTSIAPWLTTTLPRLALAVAVVVVVASAAWLAWRTRSDPASETLRRLVVMALAAPIAVGASYAPFVPSTYWSAWSAGLENRVNILASLPIAVFVFCVIALAGQLVARVIPRGRWIGTTLAVGALIALGSGYIVQLEDDKRLWAQARTEADVVIAAIAEALPHIPSRSTVYTFGHRAEVAPGVHVFAADWDLLGAVRLQRHDHTLAAYPAVKGISFRCNETGVSASAPFYLAQSPSVGHRPYGYAFFVDVPTRTADSIDDRDECRSLVARYEPGPPT